MKNVRNCLKPDLLNLRTSAIPTPPALPCQQKRMSWVSGGSAGFAVDYRLINAATYTLRYSLDLPEELFQRVADKPFLSSIDLRSGFHQLPLDDFAKSTTAFWWKKQLWQYTRLPYGNKNSVYEFQRVMDKVLADAGLSECAWAYVDDVLIASTTLEEHILDIDTFYRPSTMSASGSTLVKVYFALIKWNI